MFFGAALPTCSSDVPVIRIFFGNLVELNGRVGTLTIADINGVFVSSQPLTYQANTTTDVLFPGATRDPVTGEATDWPGWRLNELGLWVEDDSDAILRQGVNLTYAVNPTASVFVTYPPASSACANPKNPPVTPPTGSTPPGTPRTPGTPPGGPLPPTR